MLERVILIRQVAITGLVALAFSAAAAASPGVCPTGNLAATKTTATRAMTAAGLKKIHGSCSHTGVYWGAVWHVDCTFLTAYTASAPKLAKETVKHGLIVAPGFNDVQQTATGWSIDYIAGEKNSCPEPEGSPLVSAAVKSGPYGSG